MYASHGGFICLVAYTVQLEAFSPTRTTFSASGFIHRPRSGRGSGGLRKSEAFRDLREFIINAVSLRPYTSEEADDAERIH